MDFNRDDKFYRLSPTPGLSGMYMYNVYLFGLRVLDIVSKVGCNGDSDETDVKSGAINSSTRWAND